MGMAYLIKTIRLRAVCLSYQRAKVTTHTKLSAPSSRARCNSLHVAPQTRDLAVRSGIYALSIPDQHRTTEVVLRSIREDGMGIQ